jgi:acetate kinase
VKAFKEIGRGLAGNPPDADASQRGGPCISVMGSAVSAWVVPTNEELMIARHAHALVKAGG